MLGKKGFSRLTKFLEPPNLVDGIFEVSLCLQKFLLGAKKSFALEMASR